MDTIMIPTDLSPAAHNATDYAVELAKFFDARIILVHAFPVPTLNYEMPFPVEPISEFQKDAEDRLEEVKRGILKRNAFPLDIECVVSMGTPFNVIEETAKEKNPDLIVIGIVGEASALKEHLIGSTAITVARKLEVPVFIIPEKARYHTIHKISFACDLEKTEETDLIHVVKFFSKVFDADLEIVNVGPKKEVITTDKAVSYLYLEDRLKNVKHTTFHIDGDDVAKELEDYYKGYDTDVIMVNPKKHNIFYHLFNHSITKNLAFHLNLPILAIH